MFAPEDAAAPVGVVPALADDELLLDEQAASSTAPPTASAPNAARAAREYRLLVSKRSMRPRIIYISGRPDHSDHKVDLAR
jgi:hypothetical protein